MAKCDESYILYAAVALVCRVLRFEHLTRGMAADRAASLEAQHALVTAVLSFVLSLFCRAFVPCLYRLCFALLSCYLAVFPFLLLCIAGLNALLLC